MAFSPRPHRLQATGIAQHLVQRARVACFPGERDRCAFLHWLRGCTGRFECDLHAYVLMGNHVHLLLTPRHADAPAQLLRALCDRYARHAREVHGLEGGLWEECFDATPVRAHRYVLACMRYIESNPVRAGLVAQPGAWRWSSYGANALGREDALVTPHPLYFALGRTPETRQSAYRARFERAPCMLPAPT